MADNAGYTYTVNENDGNTDHCAFPKKQMIYGEHWDLVATDLAHYFHDQQDGWEASWPIELRIYRDGAFVAGFSVDRESVPEFRTVQRITQAGRTALSAGTGEENT